MIPTVFIVDDKESLRASLHRLLLERGFAVELFANAEGFLDTFDPARPGCILLDLKMPGMGGLALQSRLNERGNFTPVVVITGHGDIAAAVQSIKAGAVNFLEKPFSNQVLVENIQQAMAHDTESRQSRELARQLDVRIQSLTPREREVMMLITKGHPSRVIGEMLYIGKRTVESHRSKVMEKMGVSSVANLVALLLAHNIPAPDLDD